MLDLIDTHTHLNAPQFDEDRAAVIQRARNTGVSQFICVGATSSSISTQKAVEIAEEYPFVYATAGVHPNDAAEPYDFDLIIRLASHPKVVAIGETGLDFYRDHATPEVQEELFRRHIELAFAVNKPLIIHSRSAGERCIAVLEEMHAERVGGVFHCFAENEVFAERLRRINFLVSVPGNITFKNAGEFRRVITAVPLDQIMVETDAPYLSPEPHRGKRCETAFMVETARKVAELKSVSLEEIAAVTSANARRLFRLPTP